MEEVHLIYGRHGFCLVSIIYCLVFLFYGLISLVVKWSILCLVDEKEDEGRGSRGMMLDIPFYLSKEKKEKRKKGNQPVHENF